MLNKKTDIIKQESKTGEEIIRDKYMQKHISKNISQ